MSIKNTVGLSFEDDVSFHNQLLQETAKTIDCKILNNYELEPSLKAVKAIASLIEAKATRQKQILCDAIMNMSSSVEIEK